MQLDLILTGAHIITMDTARPEARSIGILHGRIVGLDEDIDGLRARTEINLGGKTVVPGFIDAHCHTTWFGLGLVDPSVDSCFDLEEVYDRIAVAAKETLPGEWLVASGLNPSNLNGLSPHIERLDAATGDVPLFLRHNSGHAAFVNTAALHAIGYDPLSPDPVGGAICTDVRGRPTGLVEERAQEIFQRQFQPRPLPRLRLAVERATEVYAQQGITSFTDAGIGGGWIGQSPLELAAFQAAATSGRLAARAQLMPVLDSLQPLSGHGPEENGLGLSHGMSSGFGSDLLSLGPAKVFLDGSLLAETAAMTEPYCSHGHGDLGYLQADPTVLQASMHAAYRSGWALAVHAIGDRAIDLAINILRELRDVHGPRTLPDRIEHGALIRPDQLPQLAALEVGVTPQSSFFWVSGDQMAASLGPRRSPWAYRAASLLDAGIPVAGSSDRPVADGSVLRGMQAYVDRLTSSGAVFGARKERLTRRQALSLYTTGAAAVTGMSMTKGSLSPGKLADAVVLSGSPLIAEQIADLTIEATVFGGEFRPLPTSTF